MRPALLASLALGTLLPAAQAYTTGWQPGQSYTKYMTSTASAPDAIPTSGSGSPSSSPSTPPASSFSFKDLASGKYGLEYALTHGPIARVVEKLGFNVTAQLAAARTGIPDRFYADIPLLTDENYEEDLMNEQFTSFEEEEERVWAIMVSIGMQDPVSTFFDNVFDGAYNLTKEAGDLQNVRWARVDYLAVTELTTRWGIWKAPVLVIAQERGLELRFFKVGSLKDLRDPQEMRDFFVNEEWANVAPWTSTWSPVGSRANIMAKYSKASSIIYSWLNVMPRWLLLLITGTIASTVINFLHAGEEARVEKEMAEKGIVPKKDDGEEVPEWAREAEEALEREKAEKERLKDSASASSSPSKSALKKRKGKK